MEGEPPLDQVCSLTHEASTLGIVVGMTKVEVETFPQVVVLTRSVNEELSAEAALLECAAQYSPRVEKCSQRYMFVCAIDIAGTEKLFGPPQTLAEDLRSCLQRFGITACIAGSRNFHAARTASRGMASGQPVQIIAPGHESEALAHLPLAVLDLLDDQPETFAVWGIRTLGMLAHLPEKELIARMGQTGKRLRLLARGELSHLFQPLDPVFALSENIDLESPVEVLDALLFVANIMIEQLIVRASARAYALAAVTITLFLEGGAIHARTVRPALAMNDRQVWLKLLHLDLEAHPPHAAIVAITLTAEPGKTSKVQLGLFSPQLPEPSRLDVTLARIAAIVGEGNVGRAELKDTHALDGFRMEPFRLTTAKSSSDVSASARPGSRRVRHAGWLTVLTEENRPNAFFYCDRHYRVERAYGPWLSSGEWWNSSLWGVEQWDLVARALGGEMLCCCVMKNVLRNQWQMVALYD
jgi:protein ImuB